MKNIRLYLTLLAFGGFLSSISAQQEQSLNFVQDIWQANLTNPAIMPKEKTQVLLPSIYFNLNSKNFTVRDFLQKNATGEMVFSSVVQNFLKPENQVNGTVDVQSLGTTFRIKNKFTLSIAHAAKMTPNFNLSKDFINLLVDGNAQYIGKTASLLADAQTSMHSEFSLGLAMNVNKNLTLGARAKYLNGISGAFAPGKQLDFSIDDANYAITFNNNMDVRTFALNKIRDINTASDLLKYGLLSKNNGMALDLGAVIKKGKWQFNISAVDVGASIKWKEEGKSYKSVGKYTYSGSNTDAFFDLDSLTAKSWTDTLKRVIGLQETTSAEYKQTFPTKFYISANYKFTENLIFSALIFQQLGNNLTSTGVMLDATYKVGSFLSVGSSIGLRNGSFGNLGAHLVIKGGPVRIYAVSDNILSAFRPYSTKSSNGRVGINLAF